MVEEKIDEESVVEDLIQPNKEEEKETFDEENRKLGSKSPLRTILMLFIGPLLSEGTEAFYGLADSLWVARTIGQDGISVFGAVFIVDCVAVSIGFYLYSGLNIRLSYLFGSGDTEGCSQLFVDYVRLSILLGIIVPCVIMPITRPVVVWFGADDHLADMCVNYMWPIQCLCVLRFFYMVTCGVIQAEGRSVLYGIIQAGSFILNMGVFDPLFLLGFKSGMWGASLATILAEGLPGLVLLILILSNKFSMKIKAKMFISKPTHETVEALKVGIPSLVSQISYNVPLILMQKYVNMASTSIGAYSDVIAVWSVIEKLYQIGGGACIAFQFALLPGAAYAYGAKRYNRLLRLLFHATWMAISISLFFSAFLISIPEKIGLVWGDDEEFLSWVKKMVPKVFYSAPLLGIQYTATGFIQAMQQVKKATLLSILCLFLPLPVFSSIFYFTDKHAPDRIMWAYTCNDVFSAIVCSCFLIKPIREYWNEPRDEELMANAKDNLDDIAEKKEEDFEDELAKGEFQDDQGQEPVPSEA